MRELLVVGVAALGAIAVPSCGRFDFATRDGDGAQVPAPDGGRAEARDDLMPGCVLASAPAIEALSVRFATASSVHFEWERLGVVELVEYRLAVAASPEAMARGEVVWWTQERNPDFVAAPLLEQFATAWSRIDTLSPATPYTLRLMAIDQLGQCHLSNPVEVETTAAYTQRLPLFDTAPVGATAPAGMTYQGGADPAYTYRAGDDAWHNLVLDGLSADGSALTDADRFAGAVVEVVLATTRQPTQGWASVQLGFSDGRVFTIDRLVVQRGASRRLQVPLALLADGAQVLAPGGMVKRVRSIGVGTPWGAGADVTIEEASLRW